MITRHRDGGDERALPEILVGDLGHGDIELAAEAVLETFYGVAFVFERMRAFQVQLER
jgi:hypothetical protein